MKSQFDFFQFCLLLAPEHLHNATKLHMLSNPKGELELSPRTVCSEFQPCELSLELPRVSCLPEHCHLQCPGQFSLESPLIGVKRNWPCGDEGSRGVQRPKGLSGEGMRPLAPVSLCPGPALLRCPLSLLGSPHRWCPSSGYSFSVCLEAGAPGGHHEASLPGGALQSLTGEAGSWK